MNTQKRNLCAAGVLLTAAATMVVLFLFRLSQPDKAQQSIFLNCTASDRGGWTFYTEAGQTEPVFGFGGYIDGVPAEGAGPVVAERVMEEPGERCFLQFSCVNAGLQVFLEDILLYTDFPQQENRVDVFLQNADFAGINYNGLCIPLPLDCAGKTLRIVTYGPSLNGLRVPVFPSQASRFSDAVVQTTDSDGQAGFLVRTTDTSAESAAAAANKVADQFGWDAESFEVTTIGPDWGASVIQSSLIAFLVSILLIIVYIAIRFDFNSGAAAVLGLVHDVLIMLSFMVILRSFVQMNSSFIAAMLTIVGYSINNTIIIFDRIRENARKMPSSTPRVDVVNRSIKECLGRTINTTLTTLVTIVCLYIFGVSSIREFALPIIVGIISGVYSANMINGYVWAFLEEKKRAKKAAKA